MSKKDQYKEKFIEALKQENLKFTNQRFAILLIFF